MLPDSAAAGAGPNHIDRKLWGTVAVNDQTPTRMSQLRAILRESKSFTLTELGASIRVTYVQRTPDYAVVRVVRLE